LRLTHCDLFFADAIILVEGAAEKLLMPSMIEMSASRLRTICLTVLEVGGAYAHRFEGLLSFLRIPYLVITDLDSVAPSGYPPGPTHINGPVLLYAKRGEAVRRGYGQSPEVFF
jgi:hypothetical protein